MTGWAFAWGPCIACHAVFGFNPVRVPSLRWNGKLEPICASCVARINPRRIANGLPAIVPAEDAYEPVSEAELP